MTNDEIIDLLERVSKGYIRSIVDKENNLPTSAATEERNATRLVHRTILELQTKEKKRK